MVTMPFLGSPLAFTLVYIWSRRNPSVQMSFLGLFVFSAPFLPWVLLGFSLLLGGQFPTGDMMGIAVGHVYYFLEDIWPREAASGGVRYLKTPWIMCVPFTFFSCRFCFDFLFFSLLMMRRFET